MILRNARSNDLPALAAIHAQCFDREVWNAASIGGLLATPGTFAIVDEEHCGFILARAAGGEAEVLTVAVRPAARRRGKGKGLVFAATQRAVEFGAQVMFLEVNAANNPAIALYKGLGFAEVGMRKAYYAGPHGMREDALVLKADIPLARVGISLQLG